MSRSPVLDTIFLREEVTLPHRGGMTFDELIPSTRAAFRANVKPVSLEDILEGVTCHGFNAKFLEFAQDPAVAPARLLCQFKYQVLDVLNRSRSSRFGILARSLL